MYKRNTTCTKEIQHVQKKYNMYKRNAICTKKYNKYNSSHHWRTLIFYLCNVDICNILQTDMVMNPPPPPIPI